MFKEKYQAFIPSDISKWLIARYMLHLVRTAFRNEKKKFRFLFTFSFVVLANSILSIYLSLDLPFAYINIIVYTGIILIYPLTATWETETFQNFKATIETLRKNPRYKVKFARFRHFKRYMEANKHLYCLVEALVSPIAPINELIYLLAKRKIVLAWYSRGNEAVQNEYSHTIIEVFHQVYLIDDTLWVFGWDTKRVTKYIFATHWKLSGELGAGIEGNAISSSFINMDGKPVILNSENT